MDVDPTEPLQQSRALPEDPFYAKVLTNMLRDIDEETLVEGRGMVEKLPAGADGE